MSEMERNKGKLIPTEITEEIAMKLVNERGKGLDGYETYLEKFEDDSSWYSEDYEKVGTQWYKVIWEVRYGVMDGFAEVTKNADGSIDFHTYHYNGGGHWTEVVESELKRKSK